jgi:hypothetical protein
MMRITSGNEDLPGADAERFTKLKALMHRWTEVLPSLLPGDRRQKIDTARPDCSAPGPQLTHAADDRREPIGADLPATDGEPRERQLVPLPDERSQALAVLCDRLLQELDGADVKAAEIRFVVHKDENSGCPRLDPGMVAGAGDDELVRELCRLIAWSGQSIADVVRALETRDGALDEHARELLRDELAALDVDLATLNLHLPDPVDWDSELECLLAGEVAPFDDLARDEDDENDH